MSTITRGRPPVGLPFEHVLTLPAFAPTRYSFLLGYGGEYPQHRVLEDAARNKVFREGPVAHTVAV
ncbi:MAG TPA: hypothetical protein VEX68_14685 [Bryobacteraceae bacterium]|nr:hypothetical protein [Bryobacteraceae bacterium]